MVTAVGHIAYVRETYENKDGEVQMLKRPSIHLVDVSVPTGGLGPMPADKAPEERRTRTVVRPRDAQPTVEAKAPTLEEIAF